MWGRNMRGYRGAHLRELKMYNCIFIMGIVGFFCCLQMIIQGAVREIPELLYAGIGVVAAFFIMFVVGIVLLCRLKSKIKEEIRVNPAVMQPGYGCNVTVTVNTGNYQSGAPIPQQNSGFVPAQQQYPPQQPSGFAVQAPAYGTQPAFEAPQPGVYPPPSQGQFATAPLPPTYASATNNGFQNDYNPIKY